MGSEQAREVLAQAYAHFEMHDTAKALVSVDSLNLHQEAAIRAITTAREQALREAAEAVEADGDKARDELREDPHGKHAEYLEGYFDGSGNAAAIIKSLLTKEPKA